MPAESGPRVVIASSIMLSSSPRRGCRSGFLRWRPTIPHIRAPRSSRQARSVPPGWVARRRPVARLGWRWQLAAGLSPVRLVPVARRPARLASMAHYVYVQETSFIRWVLSSGIPSRVNSPGPGQTGRPGRRRAVAVTVGNPNARDPVCNRHVSPGGERQPFHFRIVGGRARRGVSGRTRVSPYVPFSTRSERVPSTRGERAPNSGLFAARAALAYPIPFALASRGLVLGIGPLPAGSIPSGSPTRAVWWYRAEQG